MGSPGNGQVTLSWSPPSSNGGAAITDYVIRYSSDNGVTWTRFVDAVSPSTTATVIGLTNGKSYVFKVSAVNAVGAGLPSAQSVQVTPAAVPDAPTAVAGTSGNGQVALSWSPPSTTGGMAITDYVIRYSRDNGVTWNRFMDPVSPSTAAVVTGLINGTSYVFKVLAVNAVGVGVASATSAPVMPAAPTVPGAPGTLQGTAGKRSVTLIWAAPVSTGGAAITDYTVQYSSNNGSSWTTFNDSISTNTSTTVKGLLGGVNYVFRVRAINSVGAGAYSGKSSAVKTRA
jgi:predicted phage tail protein